MNPPTPTPVPPSPRSDTVWSELPVNYKRFAVLYVDDEAKSLKAMVREFGDDFRFYTATNAEDGLRLIEQHGDEIGVLLSDQRMPGVKGVQFLEKSRQIRPRMVRVLITAFSDLQAAIDAVNTGAIYKYVTKPYDSVEFKIMVRRALDYFVVQRERDQLLREKLSVLHKMVITDRVLSLGVLAAGLGHQVRNAMSAVRTFLDLAPEMLHRESLDLTQLRHPAFWQDFHRTVQGRVKTLIELLDDLSVQPPAGRLDFGSEVSLRAAVDEAAAAAGDELATRGVQVINSIPSDLPPLRGDLPKLHKLFRLILKDELAYLSAGHFIQFAAEHRTATTDQPEGVQLTVTDNGPGLPEEAILSVFDPFFTRNEAPNEFGVYLMACYFLVHHHGGTVTVGTRPEGGAIFRIFLPLEPLPKAHEAEEREFLMRVMTNERLWDKLLAGA